MQLSTRVRWHRHSHIISMGNWSELAVKGSSVNQLNKCYDLPVTIYSTSFDIMDRNGHTSKTSHKSRGVNDTASAAR